MNQINNQMMSENYLNNLQIVNVVTDMYIIVTVLLVNYQENVIVITIIKMKSYLIKIQKKIMKKMIQKEYKNKKMIMMMTNNKIKMIKNLKKKNKHKMKINCNKISQN